MAGISSSMFRKLKDFLVGRKPGDISPAEAERIQKASYALAHAEVKKRFSPTYQTILSGLNSEEKQVFEASAYYLAQIAITKQKYQQEILDIMSEKAQNNKLNPEFREYLKTQIKNISKKNNS